MVKLKAPGFSKSMLVLGMLFLYLPMVVLIVYSFNACGWFAGRFFHEMVRRAVCQ